MAFLNCTQAEYHQRSELSASRLCLIADSPRTYYETFIAKTMEQKKSAEMIRGTLLHEMVLTPDKCSFAIPPADVLNEQGHRNGSPYKQWAAEQGSKEIITADAAETLVAMRDALMRHDKARAMLSGEGQNEVGILWEDEGERLRSMLDRLIPGWIFDLKTTRHIGPYKFGREAAQLRYWMKAAVYKAALKHATGEDADFALIAVENKPPHRVAIYEFDEDYLLQGRNEYKKAIATYQKCMETGDWRDEVEKQVQTLSLPDYLGAIKLTGFDEAEED